MRGLADGFAAFVVSSEDTRAGRRTRRRHVVGGVVSDDVEALEITCDGGALKSRMGENVFVAISTGTSCNECELTLFRPRHPAVKFRI